MKTVFIVVQKLGRTRRVLKVGKMSTKYDILTFQEGKISHRGNKTNTILEMTTRKIEMEALQLKTAKMHTKKRIKKENNYCQI